MAKEARVVVIEEGDVVRVSWQDKRNGVQHTMERTFEITLEESKVHLRQPSHSTIVHHPNLDTEVLCLGNDDTGFIWDFEEALILN